MAGFDRDETYRRFMTLVNMEAAELEAWLDGEESCAVGWTRPGEAESVGRQSGRHILRLLRTPRDELDEADYRQLRKTIGFIRRHRAQEPANIVTSRWRYSLMNWGNDPLKE
jgi:hypothetical protein